MELFNPDFGLAFWLLVIFIILFAITAKYVWPAIIKAVDERADLIDKGVEYAQEAKRELDMATANAQKLLVEAQKQQMQILQEASQMKNQIVEEAKGLAAQEAKKIVEAANRAIEQSRKAAEEQFRSEVSNFALQIAEKLVRRELSSQNSQAEMIEKMLDEIEKK